MTTAEGIAEIIMVLESRHAVRVRRAAASILVRYLGGDLALVDANAMGSENLGGALLRRYYALEHALLKGDS